MSSKDPESTLFKFPISSETMGGDQAFGSLVAAAALNGKTVQQFASNALIKVAMMEWGVSREKAIRLLRALESSERQA